MGCPYQVTVFVQDMYSGEVLIRSDTTVDRLAAVADGISSTSSRVRDGFEKFYGQPDRERPRATDP